MRALEWLKEWRPALSALLTVNGLDFNTPPSPSSCSSWASSGLRSRLVSSKRGTISSRFHKEHWVYSLRFYWSKILMQMKKEGCYSATVLAINKLCFVIFLIIVDSISPLSQKLTIPLLLLEVTFIHLIPVSRGIIFSVISINLIPFQDFFCFYSTRFLPCPSTCDIFNLLYSSHRKILTDNF